MSEFLIESKTLLAAHTQEDNIQIWFWRAKSEINSLILAYHNYQPSAAALAPATVHKHILFMSFYVRCARERAHFSTSFVSLLTFISHSLTANTHTFYSRLFLFSTISIGELFLSITT